LRKIIDRKTPGPAPPRKNPALRIQKKAREEENDPQP
jgi:hypothetical protein